MANTNSMPGIKNSWSLLTFAKMRGRMQVGQLINGDTGEPFMSCIFTNPTDNSRTFVAFSSKLGELTPSEIASRKDNLQVVELDNNSKYPYKLCNVGENAWDDVNLGI